MKKKYSKFFFSNSNINLENSPYYLITQIHNKYIQNLDYVLKKYGLDNSRRQLLLALNVKNKSSISDLSNILTCKMSTTTKVVYRLKKEGLIDTHACTIDARFTIVKLTNKGQLAVQNINELSNIILSDSFEGLSPLQLDKLLNTLQHIFKNLSH